MASHRDRQPSMYPSPSPRRGPAHGKSRRRHGGFPNALARGGHGIRRKYVAVALLQVPTAQLPTDEHPLEPPARHSQPHQKETLLFVVKHQPPRPLIPFAFPPLPPRDPATRPIRPMASARRLLQTNSGPYSTLPAAEPPDPLAVDSDIVVILAALLCALICVVGLAAVARCARSRRASSVAASSKGLKKKALRALPKLAYEDAVAAAIAARGGASAAVAGEDKILVECAICLSEFAGKEEIRVLPQCGHGFHVACVDTWLGAHSSCPSCRRVLVVDSPPKLSPEPGRCGKCEAVEEAPSSSGAGVDGAAGFLP